MKNEIYNEINFNKLNKEHNNTTNYEKLSLMNLYIQKADNVLFYKMVPHWNSDMKCVDMEWLEDNADFSYDEVGITYLNKGVVDYINPLENTKCLYYNIETGERKNIFLDKFKLQSKVLFFDKQIQKNIIYPPNNKIGITDDRTYDPYAFYFTCKNDIILNIEQHTGTVLFFETINAKQINLT